MTAGIGIGAFPMPGGKWVPNAKKTIKHHAPKKLAAKEACHLARAQILIVIKARLGELGFTSSCRSTHCQAICRRSSSCNAQNISKTLHYVCSSKLVLGAKVCCGDIEQRVSRDEELLREHRGMMRSGAWMKLTSHAGTATDWSVLPSLLLRSHNLYKPFARRVKER
eukprot:1453427-Pleurochrysis_carterae.AAC.2